LIVLFQKISNWHTPQQSGLLWSDLVRQKTLKKCIELNWNFLRETWWGGGVLWKIPSVGEVCIFSVTTCTNYLVASYNNAINNSLSKKLSYSLGSLGLNMGCYIAVWTKLNNFLILPQNRYVAWNLHEEVKGEFKFDGTLDIK